ncbi:hypothetical protein acsn021_24070 [Anaerocolumna cellulosilytica]|uniref:Erythromycin biosynthesis protein CIII-like C-terminal domain-containing protein n=1 Tax=Anaerocolumna cellulosilytica TaxID=433286 RepID=A0A6S6R761_9FIRM|nr:hypothetical protein acsn021_24070 [Anaerocolumna cellulosilytica]
MGDFIRKQGFKVYEYQAPIPTGKEQTINNLVDFIEWTGMTDEEYIEQSIKAELAAIRDFKPDVIFAEARPTASISARIASIPTVMIASWPCNPEHPLNSKESGRSIRAYNNQLVKYNQKEINNLTELFYMRADVKLAPTLPELEPEMKNIEAIKFVGYILDIENDNSTLPNWYDNWLKLPQIFIYLSVSALSPVLYSEVITETFKDKPFRVICGCGYHYQLKSLPTNLPNVKFERYVSVPAIIKDTSLIIFHGGQDTMLTSLLHGVPSITIPGQHYERDYNSSKLAELGASKKLPVHAFRPTRLNSVIEEVMNGDYRFRCRELSQTLSKYGGTEQCVDIILSTACM